MLMLPILIAIPLVASVVTPLAARRIGRHAGWIAATSSLVTAALLCWVGFSGGADHAPTWSVSWIAALDVTIALRLDALALLFGLLVTGIGTAVFIYATGYLDHDHAPGRVLGWLALFQAAMLGLVMSDNGIWLFVCWELTSLCSFMLVGHTGTDAARAGARKGLLVNATGGLLLLAGVLLIGHAAGSLTISTWLADPAALVAHPVSGAGVICIALAAITKSAQWPFHFWLPQAMAAPAPVSAFLHSAALVKIGVFLLLRMAPGLEGHAWWGPILLVSGAATALVGGTTAIGRNDLKATLAATTCGALGLVVMLIGVGGDYAITAAVVLVAAHAGYKSTMFLVAGAVDHACHNRDPEQLGGLRRKMPWTWAAAIIGGFGLGGLIPSGGFVAKEVALKAGLAEMPWVVVVIVIAGAGFAIAAATVAIKPFLGATTPIAEKAHEARVPMRIGMLLAAVIGMGTGVAIAPLAAHLLMPAATAAGAIEPPTPKLWYGITLALGLSITALVLAAIAWRWRLAIAALIRRGHPVATERWWDGAWLGLLSMARASTRLHQNGSLRSYLTVVLVTTLALVGAGVIASGATVNWSLAGGAPDTATVVAMLLIAGGALAAATVRDRLAAIIGLGATGIGMTLWFIAMSAPDLATTQFLVECLTVILLVAAFRGLPRPTAEHAKRFSNGALALVVGAGATIITLIARGQTVTDPVSATHGAESLTEGYGRNVVNVILVDFRALDTLGEISVLGIAAVAVASLLVAHRKRRETVAIKAQTSEEGSPE